MTLSKKETVRSVDKYTTKFTQVNPNSLRGGWIQTLNRYNWDWFATLTFRDLPRSFTAVNRCKQWLLALQKEEQILVGYYMVTEWSKRLKCPHLHLLMGNLAKVSRSRWWHWWWHRYGGARILPYEARLGVNSYLTKYISKEVNNSGVIHIKNLQVVDTCKK